jgi:hypothetical protein
MGFPLRHTNEKTKMPYRNIKIKAPVTLLFAYKAGDTS